jgi:hypothetical protein
MLTIRAMAAAAVFAGMMIAAAPAVASCDSIYNNTCKPIPATDPPEPSAEPDKASKPLQITSRRGASRKAGRAERSAQKGRKRYAPGVTTTRVFVLRQRRAKAMAAVPRERAKPAAVEDDVEPSPPVRSAKAPRRVLTAADPGATSGEVPDVTAAPDVLRPQPVATVPVSSPVSSSVAGPVANPVEPARPAPAASPAPTPVRTVSQNEINEIDLAAAAAAPDPADQSWMRTLVLAFGGLLAVGSALRLFL